MSTFLQICKDVRAQAGIAGDGPSVVTGRVGIEADVVRWVKEAYNEIQTLHENWNFLHYTDTFNLQFGNSESNDPRDAGVRVISKDSLLHRPFGSSDKYKRLVYMPWSIYKISDFYLQDQVLQPQYWTESPTRVVKLVPTPEDDTEVQYSGFLEPDIMVDNLDEPIFPAQYHDLIKLKALMKYAEYFSVQDLARSADANYRLMLSTMQYSELPRDNLVTPAFVPFA